MGDETSLREDISFLRQMAESGRRGPIMGGIFLAGAGVVFGGASFVDGAMQNGLLPFRIGEGPLWIGAALVFIAFWLAMYFRLMRNKVPVSTAQNATFGVIWSACGAGVMVCFLTTILVAREFHLPVIQAAYVPVIYAFYGTAWFASGALARRSWMFYVGLASYLFAFIMALLITTSYVTLAMGVGLLLLLTVPGVKLAMDETKPLSDEFDISRIDDVIHGRLRLGVMAYLSGSGHADFNELKGKLQASDGNLGPAQEAEEAGYVEIEKTYAGRKPLTRVALTDKGRTAFVRYLDAIEKLLPK